MGTKTIWRRAEGRGGGAPRGGGGAPLREEGVLVGRKTRGGKRRPRLSSRVSRAAGDGPPGPLSASRGGEAPRAGRVHRRGRRARGPDPGAGAGIVRWLGITGHTHDAPRTHLEALRRFDFDTVIVPVELRPVGGPALPRRCRRASGDLSPEGRGGPHHQDGRQGPLGRADQTHTTWYEPFTDQATIDQAVAFVLRRRSPRSPARAMSR